LNEPPLTATPLDRSRFAARSARFIAMSPWHGVIMDRFLAERRERRLDSHEAVILAVEKGRITRLFHYLHDPAAFVAGGCRGSR
jgi:hypothetical protein